MVLISCPFAVICPAQSGQRGPQLQSPTPESAPLMENPGFEAKLSSWDAKGWLGGEANAISEAAHQGAAGLRLIHDSGNSPASFASGYFRVKPGKKYETRFWARTVSGQGIAVYLGFYNKTRGLLNIKAYGNENRLAIPPSTKEFREFALQGLALEEAAFVRIWIYSSAAAQVVADFDDFSLIELPPTP